MLSFMFVQALNPITRSRSDILNIQIKIKFVLSERLNLIIGHLPQSFFVLFAVCVKKRTTSSVIEMNEVV